MPDDFVTDEAQFLHDIYTVLEEMVTLIRDMSNDLDAIREALTE